MGATVNGSHAHFMCILFRTVMPLPEGLSFPAAAAISCGTGTAWGTLEMIDIRGDDTIVIFGQGPVGLSATRLATAMGARVIATDIAPHRVDLARTFGADAVVNAAEVSSVRDAVRELTRGRGATKSLETSGTSVAANQALQGLDLWGTACHSVPPARSGAGTNGWYTRAAQARPRGRGRGIERAILPRRPTDLRRLAVYVPGN